MWSRLDFTSGGECVALGTKTRTLGIFCVFSALMLGACSPANLGGGTFNIASLVPSPAPATPSENVSAYAAPQAGTIARFNNTERDCLIRAMYFESNRSSTNGMMAVGTVVMNRVNSPRFPNSICGVVGAPRQFASGVLSRSMTEPASVDRATNVADRILAGERHTGVRTAKFFHQAGLSFPYNNMHYVLEAGGNAFYMKT